MRNKIVSHNGYVYIETLSNNPVKQTTLCISQHALTAHTKLNTSHVLICKTYTCNNKLSADAVLRWIERLSHLPNCNPIVSYNLQMQNNQQSTQQSTSTLRIYEKYLKYGNLGELIDEHWQIDWQFIINLVQSVRQLHRQSIYLGALKPQNILLHKEHPQIIFTDLRMPFAHSITSNRLNNRQGRDSSDRIGSSLYVAPQIKNGNYYDQAADIYSMGVILFELVRHERMNKLLKNNQLHSRQVGKEYELEKLAAKMMEEDMQQRPNIQEVVGEIQRIHQGKTCADSLVCKQMVAMYLPLNCISPKFGISKTTFSGQFSRKVSDRVINFQMDEQALFLKSKLQLGGIELMSVFAEEELQKDIMQYFRSIRQLYEYLRGSRIGLSLTATGMLRFNYRKQNSLTRTDKQQCQKRQCSMEVAEQCKIMLSELDGINFGEYLIVDNNTVTPEI